MFVATSESINQLLGYVGQRSRANIFVLFNWETGFNLINYHFFPFESQLSPDKCFLFDV